MLYKESTGGVIPYNNWFKPFAALTREAKARPLTKR